MATNSKRGNGKLPKQSSTAQVLAAIKDATRKVDPAQVVEDAPTPSQSKVGKALNLAADAVSTFFPVAGRAAKGVLSLVHSLGKNDDEWFEAFKTAGATFAEPLACESSMSQQFDENYDVTLFSYVPCIAEVASDVSTESGGLPTTFAKEIMPGILSYVRIKNNNVLNATEDQYKTAFLATIQLYEIYYCIRKYETLALNTPVNMSDISTAVVALKPETINLLVGIGDSLRGYLETTSGLPYALSSYIRWRYGRIFHSDNTGRPGIILYDPFAAPSYDIDAMDIIPWMHYPNYLLRNRQDFIQALSTMVAKLQTTIASAGKAAADFHMAYQDHQTKWDVDEPDFDPKEYNLRLNMITPAKVVKVASSYKVALDSRLNQNAALQAVTSSCGTLSMMNGSGNSNASSYYYAMFADRQVDADANTVITPCITVAGDLGLTVKDLPPFIISDVYFLVKNINYLPDWVVDTYNAGKVRFNTFGRASDTYTWISLWTQRCYGIQDYSHQDKGIVQSEVVAPTRADGVQETLSDIGGAQMSTYNTFIPMIVSHRSAQRICDACMLSMNMHNQTIMAMPIVNDGHLYIDDYNTLAYDTATLNRTQIKSIQTMFWRNLTRGDYKAKSNKDALAAKESIAETVEVLTK